MVLVLSCQLILQGDCAQMEALQLLVARLSGCSGAEHRIELWRTKMKQDFAEIEYQRFWRGLQQLGLNAYEARTYLVLLGHSRFKALELAPRSHVPRQKIYEVLDSLVEKGFARVVQDRTKLFSAVEPNLAIPAYLARRRKILEHDLTDQARAANNLMEDLNGLYSEGRGGRGTLDFLRIVSEPAQTAAEYRRMLSDVTAEYL